MEGIVGFGFRPTDEELVGYYLHNKILGNDWLVQEFISEVNISDFDPWNLRFQSKVKSRDLVWYFFSRRDVNGDRQNRRTSSGFWKITGNPANVKDQWGTWCEVAGKIGHKKVLVFRGGRSSSTPTPKSDWVIHEYHYTLVPENQRTYVICRLEYKGHDMNILSSNPIDDPVPTFVPNATNSIASGSLVSQSVQGNLGSFNTFSDYDSANQAQWFSGDFNLQQPAVPYDDDTHRIWDYVFENNLTHY
ncbi:hypothetical protein N665_1075s0010 [Sinapis alba]|nr:hypothetical protein N665_1075s0010 [Sinapis alba]